jgi:ribosomal protein S4
MKRSLRNSEKKRLKKYYNKEKNQKTRFEVIYRAAMVKKVADERKELRYKRQLKGKIRRKKIKTLWKLSETFKRAIDLIKDPERQKLFLKQYGHLLKKERIYTPFERKLISGMKAQKILRRKKYKLVSMYKRQNLHRDKKRQYWDFFQNRKVRRRGSCYFVAWHSKNIYSLKRAFRFFYGYLKNRLWQKAYYISKGKVNKILTFLSYLENRLVVVIYRMNLALNLMQAKQFIRHGFVTVNGKKIIYCNYKIKKNDIISVNRKMFLDFILKSKNLSLDFVYNSVVKPELPHLYVKHRILTGIFLYDPLHNYNVLSKQYPSFFFGGDALRYEYIDFHSVSKNTRNFKNYVSKKIFNKKRYKENPFVVKYREIYKNEGETIPLKKVRLILSYFLKN